MRKFPFPAPVRNSFLLCFLWAAAAAGPPPAIAATAYQADPAHTGSVWFKHGFSAPLRRLWVKDLGGPISYPIIANGMVFVTVGNTQGDGTQIYGIKLATGEIGWHELMDGSTRRSNPAYDNGHLFVLNSDGLLASLKPSNGATEWLDVLPGGFFSAPTASGGTIFMDWDLNFYAINETNGAWRWNSQMNGEVSTPTIGPDGVYGSFACQIYKFALTSGSLLWNYQGGCDGGGGSTAVLYRSRLYARNANSEFPYNQVLATSTGQSLGHFKAYYSPPALFRDPASGKSYAISVLNGTMNAYDMRGGKVVWRFHGDRNLASAPLVINGQVAVGSTSGKLYLVDGLTGVASWSTNAGAGFVAPFEDDFNEPLAGFGAGEDTLVVSASHLLEAYAPQGGSP